MPVSFSQPLIKTHQRVWDNRGGEEGGDDPAREGPFVLEGGSTSIQTVEVGPQD